MTSYLKTFWCKGFRLRLAALVLLVLMGGSAYADIAVVVNPSNSIESLTEREVIDLYMGRYMAFPDGSSALPLDQPVDSKVRSAFYRRLTGKSVAQINAYWAKLIFSGRATPPRMAHSDDSMNDMITNNKNAIAYIDKADVTSAVKVVFVLEDAR